MFPLTYIPGEVLVGLLALLALSLPLLGAATGSTVLDSRLMKIVDLTATADADTEVTVTHSFGQQTPILTLVDRRHAVARVSEWLADSVTSTNVHWSKVSATTSSDAGVQARVLIWIPHTFIR